MSEFVDTNIFIRLMASDDVIKMTRCLSLFKRAERGEAHLVTSEAIVAEVIYVLSSPALYRLDRSEIARRLRPVLEIKGLRIDYKRAMLLALDLYEETKLDFDDCLAIQHTNRLELNGIYSYDRAIGRVAGINRLEP